jgi:hypothetical protein
MTKLVKKPMAVLLKKLERKRTYYGFMDNFGLYLQPIEIKMFNTIAGKLGFSELCVDILNNTTLDELIKNGISNQYYVRFNRI